MEAVPRLPMLSCELKSSANTTEFRPTLKKYIRDHYHEDGESYSKEILELETLRQNAIKAPLDFTGCSILKRYYSQLNMLQSRFPMTDDGAACVPFMWTDIYTLEAYNITDIEYEKACILYNIGALHSKLGMMDSRCNVEGMKISCTHFQCAAWAFQHLRDTYPQPKGSDMSHDLLTFFINVMLAQAQECILEKSMLDSRKSTITAKIAAQVVEYYKCALGIMNSDNRRSDSVSIVDIVGSKLAKMWKKFIEFKMAYYLSIAHLYMGIQAEEHEKWGERVAWYQSAYDNLMEAFKLAKDTNRDDLNEPLTFTMDVIGGKHSSSKKENEFVYHEKVPVISSLPALKGASLVKGIPFDVNDPDVSGSDIFARLVPMEAHEISSLYSEEKAKVLRSTVARIETKNEELMAYLSSLQLEGSTSFQEEEKIPQELLEKCAAMSVRPTAILDLMELMDALFTVSDDVDKVLKSSTAIIMEEEQKEQKYQETFGRRAPSMIIVELKKEASKYEEAHKQAAESNATLKAVVDVHISNLRRLTVPLEELNQSLPSVTSLRTPETTKIVERFNHLLSKVDEMRNQRQHLEEQLRDSFLKDDITKRLVSRNKDENIQNTFTEEIKKHADTLQYLDQNLSAQDNILCALTDANAKYADTRKAITEVKLKRDSIVQSLISSYEAYEDLVSKAQKGLEFYKKLQTNITRLLTRLRSVSSVQDEERSQIAKADLRKASLGNPEVPIEKHTPKLKDYLPYMTKGGGISGNVSFNILPAQHSIPANLQYNPELKHINAPSGMEFDRKLKPTLGENMQPMEDKHDLPSMGVRPAPVGSEQTSVPAMCTTAPHVNSKGSYAVPFVQPQWNQPQVPAAATYGVPYSSYQYASHTGQLSLTQMPPSNVGKVHVPLPPSSNVGAVPYSQDVGKVANVPIPPSGSIPVAPYNQNHYQHPSSDRNSGIQALPPVSQNQIPYAPNDPRLAIMQSSVPQSMMITPGNVTAHLDTRTNTMNVLNQHPTPSTNVYSMQNNIPAITSPSSATNAVQNYGYSPQISYGGIPPVQQSQISGSWPGNQGNVVYPQNQSQYSSMSYPQQATQIPQSISYTNIPNTAGAVVHPSFVTQASTTPRTIVNCNSSIPTNVVSQQTIPYSQTAYSHPQNFQPTMPQYHQVPPVAQFQSADQSSVYNAQPLQPVSSVGSTSAANATSPSIPLPVATPPPLESKPVIRDLITPPPNPESPQFPKATETVLQPKVIDIKSIAQNKEKEAAHAAKDPLDDSSVRAKFVSEVEKYEKLVEGLVRKSLNGTTPLDQKWKEFIDAQDKESRKFSISVARCYPLKNRFPDIMPYDGNRVKLISAKDDYINASYLKDVSANSPVFLITQAPLPATFCDFWLMVWEQQVETLICLFPDGELKNHIYFPKERGQSMSFGAFEISLQSQKEKSGFVERMVNVTHVKNRTSRVVVHLQFGNWPASGIPDTPSSLLQFIAEVLNYQKQQRNLLRPVAVHCSSGVGRSGCFSIIAALVSEMNLGHGPKDVAQVAVIASQQRKFLIQDKDQLKFCYDVVLYYAQDILMRRGILTSRASFEDKRPGSAGSSSHVRHPSEDFILGGGGLAKLQSDIAKMGLASDQVVPTEAKVPCEVEPAAEAPPEEISKPDETSSENDNPCSDIPKTAADTPVQSITSLLDPNNFTLDAAVSPSKRKITKENFASSKGSLSTSSSDSADPLSQLDPLWSLKKK